MKFLLICSFLCFTMVNSLNAQTLIKGKVRTPKGKPVPGASIALKDSYDGATSDSLGNFEFETTEKGAWLIQVSAIGFKQLEQPLEIGNQSITLDLVLREAVDELKAVVVTAGSFEASDAKRTTVLSAMDVVTTASANADVTGAIRTLPGTQQVGEKEGLFVRGGSGEEARVFIDGTLVNNFFYTSLPDIATRGRFSPFLFKGTVFSSGGYSALYGQALSGALILETIDLPEKTTASIGISTVGLSGGYQHLNEKKNASWGLNYGYTNLLPYFELFKQRPDYFRVPAFHYGDANFRVKTSKTGMLKFYATFQQNELGLRQPDIDSSALKNAFSLTNYNVYANLSWKERLGKKWKIYIGTSYSTNKDDIQNQLEDPDNKASQIEEPPFVTKSFDMVSKSDLLQVKTVIDRSLGTGLSAWRIGGEWLYFSDNLRYRDTFSVHTKPQDQFKAAFTEADIYITNDLAAKIGLRAEQSSLMDRANLAPRFSMAYKVGLKGQASLAYGVFYQKPERNQLIINPSLQFTKASHYIANYQLMTGDYTLRLETFYKEYEDLVKTHPKMSNNGRGYAKGIELFWRDKKTVKNVDYWFSYSYLDTKRDYLNYPGMLQPNFAANHTASLVVKKFMTKWKMQVNASYSFATGRPYYYFAYDPNREVYTVGAQGKTMPYNNMGLSLNYLPTIGKDKAKAFTVWVFSVTNVLNQKQIFNYNYSYDGRNKLGVRPAANQFFFLGCFISIGVDRTQDIINSNL
ncbi:MAG TPA: TonB-dependent receptor [Flavihumibacter sp.]|jgi:vitamin B12 transporter